MCADPGHRIRKAEVGLTPGGRRFSSPGGGLGHFPRCLRGGTLGGGGLVRWLRPRGAGWYTGYRPPALRAEDKAAKDRERAALIATSPRGWGD